MARGFMRALLAAALTMIASPAIADTLPITPGVIPVHRGDVLVTSKPLIETTDADGNLVQRYASGWIDRMTGKTFALSTGTKLKPLTGAPRGGYVANGYTYLVVDGNEAVAPLPPAPAPVDRLTAMFAGAPLWGVNISGCSFTNDGALCPTVASVNQYLDKGFTMVRLSFLGKQMANPAIRAKVVAATVAAVDRGAYVVLDRHDYSWPTPPDQVAFWVDLMASMPDSDRIIIDPMNEPKAFNDPVLTNDWDQWARDANLILAGMRTAGLRNIVAMEYPSYSATFRAFKKEAPTKASESALTALDRVGGLKDPLGLALVNGHRYFDKGSSGTQPTCQDAYGFDNFAEELRKRGLKGIITESAAARFSGIPASCVVPLQRAVTYLRDNADTIVGVTWWGGGAAWNESYLFKIEPRKGTFATTPNSVYLDRLLGR